MQTDFSLLDSQDTNSVVEQFRYLAVKIARKYSNQGHVELDFEDLKQDMLLGLVEAANAVKLKKLSGKQIYWFVSRCLNNHVQELLARNYRSKRSFFREIPDEDFDGDYLDMFPSDYANKMYADIFNCQVRELLSGLALQVFDLIMDPSEDLLNRVVKSSLRKSHVSFNRKRAVRGSKSIRILPKHVREYLGVCHSEFVNCLDQIRLSVDKVLGSQQVIQNFKMSFCY